jgi:hypothetical protein
MAFSAKNLRPIGDNTTVGVIPNLWVYFNAAGDTVTTAGYIPMTYGVKAKDMVAVIPAAGTSMAWYHATVSSGKITLAANS